MKFSPAATVARAFAALARAAFAARGLAAAALIGYLLVSGLRSTVLRGLQSFGAAHPIGGENPISFCNVFFLSQLMVGLALVLAEPARVGQDLRRLEAGDRRWIALDGFLGCFVAPVAFYFALERLSVITQTLLFALTLPASALLAQAWLREKLPPRFGRTLVLILAGLVVGKLFGSGRAMGTDQLEGVLWALVSVGASAVRASLRRLLACRRYCRGMVTGLPNLAGAFVFAVIALRLYGPQHFFYLRSWWVFWVIVVYGLTLCLGTEVLRQLSSRHFNVLQVSLAGSAGLAVTVFSAALFLGEPLTPAVLLSVLLILAGVLQRFLPSSGPAPA